MTLQVSAGYGDIYRGTAWTPVRVTLRNGTNADLQGVLEIPESSQAPSIGASPSFHGLYEVPLLLPAGGTKQVTSFVPGSGVQGQVMASFRQGNKVLASASAFPIGIDTSALLIGVLASNQADMAWIARAIQQQVTSHVVRLSPATLDPLPAALASFDLIVLTNVDTSQLDSAQLGALERYIHDGGSLLLIGGPTWQETLRPLPEALLPGRLAGMRTLPDLHGLASLGPVPRAAGPQTAAVSVLTHPGGTVVAAQAGVPLVTRTTVGQGAIEYLAFDPSLDPVQRWSGSSPLIGHLIAMAAPLAIGRTWTPQGFRGRFLRAASSMALTNELSNLPPLTLPLLALFAILTLVYVLVLGPANFLVLRRLGRQHLALVTIPLLAVSYLAGVFALTTHLRGSSVLLNSVGMITLDGGSGSAASADGYPATFYQGLVAPLPGDYHLTYGSAGLPAALPALDHTDGFFWRNASTLRSTPLGMRLQEGAQTAVNFLSMSRWSMRDVTLTTSVRIPGAVRNDLALDARGDVSGAIYNGTNLDLLEPVIVAGQTVAHLPDLPAGATIHARVQPSSDASDGGQSSLWSQLYGGPDLGGGDGFGFHGCCDQVSFPQEATLLDRVRNATTMLSQSQSLSALGQVLLIGWSERPLGTVTVDGSAPQRRDLNLIVVPLAVHFPSRGPFVVRSGTFGAHLVDIVPRAPDSSCCFFSRFDHQLSVGPGGSFTFEFDTPTNGLVRFNQLALTVNSGDDGVGAGRVYDWRAHRWVGVDLSGGTARLPDPNRFVSPRGQIMLALEATSGSGDLTISDPYGDVQLSGAGVVQ